MGKFKEKIYRFMYGRYGTDQLSIALIGGGFAFYILYVFTRSRLLYLVSADALNHKLEQEEEYTPTDKVLSYINTHYMEDITLEDLASHVHLSRHYLVHLFRNETGKTPFEFITSTRLEQAKRLLSCTNLSIAEIAIQCGFESSSYFCRRFRTAFGTTPRAFKKEKN